MKRILNDPRVFFAIVVVFLGAIFRLLPHWPNFTPIAAMALFGGTYIKRKELAMIIPLAAMFLSDLVLGFHNHMWAVYLSFILITLMGYALRKNVKVSYVAGFSLISSALFFLITNFAVWIGNPFYPQDFQGLLLSYTAGIPFFLNGLAGDLFFNALFFGGYALAIRRLTVFSSN